MLVAALVKIGIRLIRLDLINEPLIVSIVFVRLQKSVLHLGELLDVLAGVERFLICGQSSLLWIEVVQRGRMTIETFLVVLH